MTATTDSPNLSEKALQLAEKVFDALWSAGGPQDAWHWALLVLIVLIAAGAVATVTFKALGSAVEHLVKLVEVYKSSGLPMWLNEDNKSRVRRRKQFCGVLDADLAYLAKAENWNDQYFTDLEAEVETEGGYYATAWHRLRRKKSFGLRKERSLIQAITSSTERAMQLVGEPGSGKSVALRHLAKQLAEQGRKSNDKNAIVPLYINLREMDNNYIGAVTANDVREFVLENIRRGDADTSAFVRENWDDYCNRGIWLFLFDSFDEIPAVLHSEAGSNVVRQYSQAIRQFLEGMGECKGILASREFKGPEALPWKKLRILPLSGQKQDELIQNSFLNASQMSLVRQHLANSDNSIGATPLFLTLLCRYVRDEQRAPTNDHDILLQHIERLARREPEYLQRKYKFTVEELINGAERLAQLFAEDDTLSLAPTLDQIVTQLPTQLFSRESIERMISALVDCKIGRADVPNAAHGDRRFAFAHRRYQEALFVRYLARHPEAISAAELLNEPRWREYTVTLLQTRAPEEIKNLLDLACTMLDERAANQAAEGHALPPLPSHLMYFNWTAEIAVPLLSLLQEGLARRLQDVPITLSNAVHHFLEPRWQNGDTWDRCEVLRLGGLLPHNILVNYLVESFENGTVTERAHAFKLAAFASGLPESTRTSVLSMLSDQVLIARDRADQLSLEAMAARLPASMGANFVVSRGNKIRRNFQWIQSLGGAIRITIPMSLIERSAHLLMSTSSSFTQHLNKSGQSLPTALDLSFPLFFLIFIWTFCMTKLSGESSNMLWLIFAITTFATLSYALMLCPYLVRSYGKEIGFSEAASWALRLLTPRKFFVFTVGSIILASTAIIIGWPLGYAVDWVTRTYFNINLLNVEKPSFGSRITIGLISSMSLVYAIGIVSIAVNARKNHHRTKLWNNNLDRLKRSESSDVSILYSATNIDELACWLRTDETLLDEAPPIRGFSSFVLDSIRQLVGMKAPNFNKLPTCLSSDKLNIWKLEQMRQILEERFKGSSH
ncbi:hypothetical protein PS862_00232 [Pseudomonas fluorescens]|uniref:NACHT domain-containing protein n=1 Tax=Pseudomonas fluorescens TaxID=294 RepID=A0A5E7GCX0_PSEFL|nr:NACHT domain-containing protein [Pseudomonas fluorescens]VVO49425.1 hypothetical protein PS862_00232 [Pseudomonas fluorescens]